ncbi:hypothetical protein A6A04_03725 [Paramagnetospirillum marisnigri]|uniref:SGNH hydrolase-type esterase domain-containing protein n=1 Tax=Paramagnetospirillum marisnigri TaxID=1285242 RepID=A0A178MMS1_9PROT|nr:SGNH/GDSL hydrolase family protein [Paramagnetospirillum marisnigri]OAN49234.1 hypothetical protein A6A04_03725 [Paramagnetospirillum marisnigri]
MVNSERVVMRVFTLALSIALAIGAGEILLRVKNSSMRNYDMEMWKYSRELKQRLDNPDLPFTHVTSRTAQLESVEIRLNEVGLRGAPLDPAPQGGRRILFIGGSTTLGWGVAESDTVSARVERMLTEAGEKAQVLNGGVANYNAQRYVTRFFQELAPLKPTDIVVNFFHRDAEDLKVERANPLLRHSQLAYTLWLASQRLFERPDEQGMAEHYRKVYDKNSHGFQVMRQKLRELSEYAKSNGIRIYLTASPDVHNLVDYKYGFIHDIIHEIANEDGYTFIDLLPSMKGRSAESLFAMPGDPHPNALGHQLMAEAIFPVIHQPPANK